MLRAGKLRHRVTIETFTETQDSFGEPDKTWSADTTIGNNGAMWAAIEPQRGRERFDADQEAAIADVLIRVRYDEGITPEHRVVWGSHTYDIDEVRNIDTRDREIHLYCNEVNPAAS